MTLIEMNKVDNKEFHTRWRQSRSERDQSYAKLKSFVTLFTLVHTIS